MNRCLLAAFACVVFAATIAHAQDCSRQPPRFECRARLPGWYFDTTADRCVHRGCLSQRDNRYTTKDDCEDACEEPSREDSHESHDDTTGEDHDRDDADDFERDFSERDDPDSHDDDDADDDDDSDEVDPCQLPSEVGPCRERATRYYFDTTRGRCRRFNYGGCQGNANNFETKHACRRQCGRRRTGGRGRRPHDKRREENGEVRVNRRRNNRRP